MVAGEIKGENDEIQQECNCCNASSVSRSLIPPKLFYFFFFGGNGSLIPYLVLFFKQLGLTPSQVGIVSGLKPFISFLFSPVWGYIADKSRRTRLIYVLSLLAYIGGYLAYSLAPTGELCKHRANQSSPTHHPYMIHMQKKRSNFFTEKQNRYNLYVDTHNSTLFTKEKAPLKLFKEVNKTFSKHSQMTLLYSDLTPGLMGESLFHMPAGAAFFGNNDLLFNHFVASKPQDDNEGINLAETSEKTWHGSVHHPNAPWTICAAAKANSNDNLSLDQTSEHRNLKQKTFHYLLIVTLVATLFSCPLITIVDTATIRKLREGNCTHKYGNQRMWGSLGWGLVAFIVGAIISILPLCPGINNEVNYYPAFYIFIVFLVFALLVGLNLQFEDKSKEDYVDSVQPHVSRTEKIKDGLKLLKNPIYFSFIVTAFSIGVTMSVIKTFLFWYLKDIGGPQILFSIIAAVNCTSEVTVYFFASRLITRLTHFGVLYITMICYALRLFYYGLLTNPWYVLAAEPLSGITTAAAWATMTSYVGKNAIPEISTTMQGILHGTHWGLGHGIGELIGGFMVSNLGAASTFNIFGTVTLFHLLIFWLVNNYANKDDHGDYEKVATEVLSCAK